MIQATGRPVEPLRLTRRGFVVGVAGGLLASVVPFPSVPVASANVFGPPWLGAVVVDRAITRQRPSLDAPAIGPLARGAKVPVTHQVTGTPGPNGDTTWYATTVGFLPASTVSEFRQPWIGQVHADRVPIRTSAMRTSGVRRQARPGDLLRVVGISPGVGGDTGLWWATTEGWLDLNALWETPDPQASAWDLPAPDEAPNGWWAEVTTGSNVRTRPTTEAPRVGLLEAGKRVKVLGEEQGEDVLGSATWYRIDGGRYAGARLHSSLVRRLTPPGPIEHRPGAASADGGTWMVVHRGRSVLTLYQNGQPAFSTYVSLGTAASETPNGQYVTFGKYHFNDMTSTSVKDPSHPYDLPNVPSVQYYKAGGYAVHGTYWHDDFGLQHSEGCINLTMTDGAYVFARTKPAVASSENVRYANGDPATPLFIVG